MSRNLLQGTKNRDISYRQIQFKQHFDFSTLFFNCVNENDQTLIQHNSTQDLVQVDDKTKVTIRTHGGHHNKYAKQLDVILPEFFGYLQNEPNLHSLYVEELLVVNLCLVLRLKKDVRKECSTYKG